MAIKVQHSELTGALCHEPKGADTAAANTVYIADGSGSGSFQQVPLSIIDFTKTTVADITPTAIDDAVVIDGTNLTQITDEEMADVPYSAGLTVPGTNALNKNLRELYKYTINANTRIAELNTAITNLNNKLNTLLAALRSAGVVDNGE